MKLIFWLILFPSVICAQSTIKRTSYSEGGTNYEVVVIEEKAISKTEAEIIALEKIDSIKRMKQRIADGWNIKLLNTGNKVGFMNSFEKEVLLEVNMCRSNPSKYVKYIQQRDGDPVFVKSCIDRLSGCKSLSILQPDSLLSVLAKENAFKIADSGMVGHYGPPYPESAYGGSIDIDNSIIAREYVTGWLVDDGNLFHQRTPYGHREHILTETEHFAGIGYSQKEGFLGVVLKSK
ncbi:hypothetical protein QNI16_23560 [Cytophagaceae bacterium YF14B1]|uniref:Uncharacterized protein n=1 Tax=Xanthocytophaga flava TaxID=3048013 RepID=A0AAE3U8J2_9BACT|nr:hypothetical protein [Xanthocytophaga flavus]MDJ1483496.1 hypothetical protein [Xanthocytophaga flavus]